MSNFKQKVSIILLSIMIFAMGCSSSEMPTNNENDQNIEENESERTLEDYGISVMAKDVIESYEANELNADKQYLDETLCVAGRVEDVGKDYDEEPYITIGTGGFLELNGIRCYLQENQLDIASELVKGDQVIVLGICEGLMTFDVKMKDCELINVRSQMPDLSLPIELSGKEKYVAGLDFDPGRYTFGGEGEVSLSNREGTFWHENMDVFSYEGPEATTIDFVAGDVIQSKNSIYLDDALSLMDKGYLHNGLWVVGFDIAPGNYNLKIEMYQPDGQLVLYDPDGNPYYSLDTHSENEYTGDLGVINGTFIAIRGIETIEFSPK